VLTEILTDPLVTLTIRWSLAVVFGLAVFHKLRAITEFTETLRAYRVLPAAIVLPAACVLIALESAIVAGLVFNTPLAAKGAIGLLCLYAAAITINLARGRSDLDCGCGGPTGQRKISGFLVLRNLALAVLAGLSIWPSEVTRDFTWLDAFTALAATATIWFMASAASQLSRTRFLGRRESLTRAH